MSKIDETFTAILEVGENKGSWTRVIWPMSAEFFGTKGMVKVKGEIDGYPFQATFVAMGGFICYRLRQIFVKS